MVDESLKHISTVSTTLCLCRLHDAQ